MRRKRKKSNRKKEAQRKHFEKRSLERVGVVLNRKELIRKIQNNELEFLERQSHRVSIFRFEYLEEFYRIVYDKERKQIVTILYDTEEQWQKKK